MTARRAKFRWSNQQIIEALGPHAIPDPDDERIVRDLAEFGALQILARREGGRKPTIQSARGEIRRIVISAIFEGSGGYCWSSSSAPAQNPYFALNYKKGSSDCWPMWLEGQRSYSEERREENRQPQSSRKLKPPVRFRRRLTGRDFLTGC